MLEPLVTLVSIFQLHLRFHNYYTVIQFVFNFLFFSLFIHSNIYTDLAIILSTFPVYVQFNSLFLSVHSSILRPTPPPPARTWTPSQEDRVQTRVQASPPRVIPRVRLSVTKPDLSPAYESEFSSWNVPLSLFYCNYTYNDFPLPWRFVINHNRLRSVEPEWMHTPRFREKLSLSPRWMLPRTFSNGKKRRKKEGEGEKIK